TERLKVIAADSRPGHRAPLAAGFRGPAFHSSQSEFPATIIPEHCGDRSYRTHSRQETDALHRLFVQRHAPLSRQGVMETEMRRHYVAISESGINRLDRQQAANE